MATAAAEVESSAEDTQASGKPGKERPSFATTRFVIGRVLRALFTIYVVATATFFLVRLLPGNPVQVFINEKIATEGLSYSEAAAQAASLFSFDPNKPLVLQYVEYLIA
ncbi:MAG TPA: ABC transporter permease, partial [Actinopolymorphaceae bacterium]